MMELLPQTNNDHFLFKMPDLVRLWILRILVLLDTENEFVKPGGFKSDRIASGLGLDSFAAEKKFDASAAIRRVRELHREAEEGIANAKAPRVLRENIQRLAELVDLTECDCRLLEFAVLLRTEPFLTTTVEWPGAIHSTKVVQVLEAILHRTPAELTRSMSRYGALGRAGLLSIDRVMSHTLSSRFTLNLPSFAYNISTKDIDLMDLLKGVVEPCSTSDLDLTAYDHVGSALDVLIPYLRRSAIARRRGVNVLVYGVPGTGKSQLARVLASEVDSNLFEITSEDPQGVRMCGVERLEAFRAAQCFLEGTKSLVLFDEIEDLFSDGSSDFAKERMGRVSKAMINRVLENNPVPAFWLSNSIAGIDRAFVRRFDFVFELPVAPKKNRERMIQATCLGLISTACAARVAESERLAPAVVSRMASVLRLIESDMNQDAASKAFDLLVSNSLQAQRHQPLRSADSSRLPETYDPAFICADAELDEIADGLRSSRAGRLCLYGPPGTGKTAYGRWLADHLGLSLTVKRASDLISPYVGETERLIAEAFVKADRAGELLMIDEVDSFLQDRRSVRNSWEILQVNEMLTQLESFGGVFVASTNLMDGIDPAALRRFDLKVKFDFLQPAQASNLLVRHCASLGFASPAPAVLLRIERLGRLTPGDFATVARRHRFRQLTCAKAFVEALEKECSLKSGQASAVGFIH